ncbi:unnamed protein product, partial [Ectocarpus sp. 12 AP-2014]
DAVRNFFQRVFGTADVRNTGRDGLIALLDNFSYFFGSITGAMGQLAHLRGDNRKAKPGFAGSGRFDACVKRQQIDLKRDVIDHIDNTRDFFRTIRDAGHRIRSLSRNLFAGGCGCAGFLRACADFLDIDIHLTHAGRKLLQGG